jgi:glycosyltransferase involved in cell wall biosynthesis
MRTDAPYTFISFARTPRSTTMQTWDQITSRLAREHRVLFCSRVAPWAEALSVLMRNPLGWRSGQVTRNLVELRPWPWLPRVPQWGALDAALQKLHVARIRASLERHGWDNRIVYIWHPAMADMAGRFDERLVCFHLYDDFGGYTFLPERERLKLIEQTRRLAQRADLVLAAGHAMGATLGRDDVCIVPNGVDAEAYARAARRPGPAPDELRWLPRPIVAHVGRLMNVVDYELLEAIARRRPSWSIVLLGPFVGGFTASERRSADRLLDLDNVHHIGGKPAVELPRYVAHIDVGLIAYRLTGWIRRIFPLKTLEYLAAGKPCVSAPIDELVHHWRHAAVASTPDEWVAAIERALAESSPELIEKRMALARDNSWDARCRQIVRLIDERLAGEGSGARQARHERGDR